MATRNFGSRLETRPTYREAIRIKTAPLSERLAESEQRQRFLALWDGARPSCYYEYTRAEERRKEVADNNQRVLIQQGLRNGSITLDRYMDYRLWQIETDLACIPTKPVVDDVSFTRFVTETGEGLEASVQARGNPTIERIDFARKQIAELVAAAQLYTATMERRA